MSKKIDLARRFHQQLLSDSGSLMLSTASAAGHPDVGSVPFILNTDNDFIILISQLAQHTSNLQENPVAAVMLVEDEADADNLFARKRLQLSCEAAKVSENDRERMLGLMIERHGKIVNLLSSLPDFTLMRLHPVSGQFVMGFGQAYRLSGPSLKELELIAADKTDQST
jgi:putative heme iron utilization protein